MKLTRLIIAAVVLSASGALTSASAQWVHCGGDGDTCTPTSKELITVRFGGEGDYVYVAFSNQIDIDCGKSMFGDPAPQETKECYFTTQNVLGVPEGNTFSPGHQPSSSGSHPYRWIRYESGNGWRYEIYNPNLNDNACAPYVELDCEYSSVAFALDYVAAAECATGYNVTCSVTENTPLLLQFGGATQFGPFKGQLYPGVVIVSEDNSLNCLDYFPVLQEYADAFHPIWDTLKNPTCLTMPLVAASATTVGTWELVKTCQGGGECDISYEVQVGTTQSSSETTTQTWSETVTLSMEAGFTLFGQGGKVSASSATTYANSDAFTEALSTTVTTTSTTVCEETVSSTNLALYQFTTSTTANCLSDPECSGVTHANSYFCAVDYPSDYMGPACLPIDCDSTDPLCLTCVNDST